jgi:hypothetical protein
MDSHENIFEFLAAMGGGDDEEITVSTPSNIIDMLPMTKGGGGEHCTVCLTDMGLEDDVRVTPCFHRFHVPCIDEWLNQSTVCPNCKTDVVEAVDESMKVGSSIMSGNH